MRNDEWDREGDEQVKGELQKQDNEEEGKEGEGHGKYSSEESQHTLQVSQASLNAGYLSHWNEISI